MPIKRERERERLKANTFLFYRYSFKTSEFEICPTFSGGGGER